MDIADHDEVGASHVDAGSVAAAQQQDEAHNNGGHGAHSHGSRSSWSVFTSRRQLQGVPPPFAKDRILTPGIGFSVMPLFHFESAKDGKKPRSIFLCFCKIFQAKRPDEIIWRINRTKKQWLLDRKPYNFSITLGKSS